MNDKISMNKMGKFRKLLGDRYHLYASYTVEDDRLEWKLYRRYDDCDAYFSPKNKAIMTSETNTIDDLLEFAKDHVIYDPIRVASRVRMAILLPLLLLSMANIFWNLAWLRTAIISIDIVMAITMIADIIVSKHNFKVKMQELREDFVRRSCVHLDAINKMLQKSKNFTKNEDSKSEKETDKAENAPKKRKYVRKAAVNKTENDKKVENNTAKTVTTPKKRKYTRRVDATKAKSTTNTAKKDKKSRNKESE